MSLALWNKLPPGFLRKGYDGWSRLDYDVRLLIVQLAKEQGFKCAHCKRERRLIVEHDHDPDHGRGDRYTVYNIRGIVCQRCNWHLMIYEKDLNGEYRGFDEAYSYISGQEYEAYIYSYDCRVAALYDEFLKATMEPQNYWRRKNFLFKFDDWKEYGGHYPWFWGFDEIKDQKYGKIRTPQQFFKGVSAILHYIKGELEKNPNYEPPEKFIEFLFRLKPFLDELYPIIQAQMLELGELKNLAAGASE